MPVAATGLLQHAEQHQSPADPALYLFQSPFGRRYGPHSPGGAPLVRHLVGLGPHQQIRQACYHLGAATVPARRREQRAQLRFHPRSRHCPPSAALRRRAAAVGFDQFRRYTEVFVPPVGWIAAGHLLEHSCGTDACALARPQPITGTLEQSSAHRQSLANSFAVDGASHQGQRQLPSGGPPGPGAVRGRPSGSPRRAGGSGWSSAAERRWRGVRGRGAPGEGCRGKAPARGSGGWPPRHGRSSAAFALAGGPGGWSPGYRAEGPMPTGKLPPSLAA